MTNRLVELVTFILKFRNNEDKNYISLPMYFDNEYERISFRYLQHLQYQYLEYTLFVSQGITVKLYKLSPTQITGDLVISGLGEDEQKLFSNWINGKDELYNKIIRLDI